MHKSARVTSARPTPKLHPLWARLLFVFFWGPEWLLQWGLRMHERDGLAANDNSASANDSQTICAECGARREFSDWRTDTDRPRHIDIFALH